MAGLALSIGLGATLNAGWLLFGLIRMGTYKPQPGWLAFGARVLVAGLVLGGCLAWAEQAVDWLDRAHPALRALKLAGVLGGVAVVYVAVLLALGIKVQHFARKA